MEIGAGASLHYALYKTTEPLVIIDIGRKGAGIVETLFCWKHDCFYHLQRQESFIISQIHMPKAFIDGHSAGFYLGVVGLCLLKIKEN